MANLLPTPVAAAIGIVPAVFDGVRSLPGRALQLPVTAISSALATVDLLRREYDDLADRGERLVARLRGTAVEVASDPLGAADSLEDRIEDIAARTPFAAAYDRTEDALEDVVDRVKRAGEQAAETASKGAQAAAQAAADVAERTGQVLDSAADTVEDVAGTVADRATDSAAQVAGATADVASRAAGTAAQAADSAAQAGGTAADTVGQAAGAAADAVADTAQAAADTAADAVPEDEKPKGVPTPRATGPDSTRIDTAASPSVRQAVQEAVQEASAGKKGALSHDELPLPDYDHMTLGSLRGRLRSLSVEQLVQVRTYEKAHADRLPVVTMLDNRIAKLATDASAQASGPVSTSSAPE